MWIFGYGSLVWHTNFPYETSLVGCVKGYVRRFWQASPDHRGTNEQPGRTVTLVPDVEGEVWGVAYKVPEADVKAVREYLDWRERAGYELLWVTFHPHPSTGKEPFDLEVYISPATDNPHYIGHTNESIQQIAEKVVSCCGESGTNIEYVLRLAHCMRILDSNVKDDHLFELESEVLRLCKERKINDKCFAELGHAFEM